MSPNAKKLLKQRIKDLLISEGYELNIFGHYSKLVDVYIGQVKTECVMRYVFLDQKLRLERRKNVTGSTYARLKSAYYKDLDVRPNVEGELTLYGMKF